MPFTYDYPRPMVTVDALVFRRPESGAEVLLIQRKEDPFAGQWALPGGFVDMDETLEAAVARELAEETGLKGIALEQFHTFGDPGRDPRGRSITVVYRGRVYGEGPELCAADDAAAAAWFPVDQLPTMAFDHGAIVAQGLGKR